MTWDPTCNAMLSKYSPGPCRAMSMVPGSLWSWFSGQYGFRLDRMIVSSRNKSVSIDMESSVKLFAHTPVGNGAPEYLFPSDHFGLVATFGMQSHADTI